MISVVGTDTKLHYQGHLSLTFYSAPQWQRIFADATYPRIDVEVFAFADSVINRKLSMFPGVRMFPRVTGAKYQSSILHVTASAKQWGTIPT